MKKHIIISGALLSITSAINAQTNTDYLLDVPGTSYLNGSVTIATPAVNTINTKFLTIDNKGLVTTRELNSFANLNTTNTLTLTGNTLESTVNGVKTNVVLEGLSGSNNETYWLKTSESIPTTSENIFTNGKVAIGTKNLLTGINDAQLTVNGRILAEEVRVIETIAAAGFKTTPKQWADKVFEKNYSLMPLEDLQKFISENKHLPEIPSEKEVMAKGIEITDMNVKLLQKVEELTLYILNQNEEVKELKERLNKIENNKY